MARYNSSEQMYDYTLSLLTCFECQSMDRPRLDIESEIKGCDDALYEYSWMLRDAIERGDSDEVSTIRAEMQNLRVERRRLIKQKKEGGIITAKEEVVA